jgi:hypothetical protein
MKFIACIVAAIFAFYLHLPVVGWILLAIGFFCFTEIGFSVASFVLALIIAIVLGIVGAIGII